MEKKLFAKRYQQQKILGVGGMGCVYEVQDKLMSQFGIQSNYALKVMNQDMSHYDDADALLMNEFLLMQHLNHSLSIANVHHFFSCSETQRACLLMPIFDGEVLSFLLPVLNHSQRLHIAKQLVKAVQVCHKNGVIHGDIKPGNIYIEPEEKLTLFDFSLGRWVDESKNKWAMDVRKVKGWSAKYASPRLTEGNTPTIADDIYATAKTIEKLLFDEEWWENTSSTLTRTERHAYKPLKQSLSAMLLLDEDRISELTETLYNQLTTIEALSQKTSGSSWLGRMFGFGVKTHQ